MIVRSFTPAGIHAFSEFLNRFREGEAKVERALEIARDTRLSIRFEPAIEYEPKFTTRKKELAEQVCRSFECSGLVNLPLDPSEMNLGMWAWMAAANFQSVRGRPRLRSNEVYILTKDNFRNRWYRHSIAGPARIYWLFRDSPSDANLFLFGVAHQHSDDLEQFGSRTYTRLNRPVLTAANRLYFNASGFRPKRGRQDRTRPGTIRHFISMIRQLDRTYDLQSMTPEQILDLLPPAFDRWRS